MMQKLFYLQFIVAFWALGPIAPLKAEIPYKNNSISGHPLPVPGDILLPFGQATSVALKKRINILVWNLHKGGDDDFSKDFNDLSYKKDLIASQEMLLNPLMLSVFAQMPNYLFNSATSFYMEKEKYRTGVFNASPVAANSINYVKTETLEPVVSSPKMAIITQYPIAGSEKSLTLVNLHGINFVNGEAYKKEINRIYEAVKDLPSPLIFTGDFNTWSDERDNILREVSQKLKLSEAHFFPDNRMKFNNHFLDHFFYTEDIRVIDAKVEGFYKGSDHKPLEVIVEYSPRPLKK